MVLSHYLCLQGFVVGFREEVEVEILVLEGCLRYFAIDAEDRGKCGADG